MRHKVYTTICIHTTFLFEHIFYIYGDGSYYYNSLTVSHYRPRHAVLRGYRLGCAGVVCSADKSPFWRIQLHWFDSFVNFPRSLSHQEMLDVLQLGMKSNLIFDLTEWYFNRILQNNTCLLHFFSTRKASSFIVSRSRKALLLYFWLLWWKINWRST